MIQTVNRPIEEPEKWKDSWRLYLFLRFIGYGTLRGVDIKPIQRPDGVKQFNELFIISVVNMGLDIDSVFQVVFLSVFAKLGFLF